MSVVCIIFFSFMMSGSASSENQPRYADSESNAQEKFYSEWFLSLTSAFGFSYDGIASPAHGKVPDIKAVWSGDPRWMGGINWGGHAFYGSLSPGVDFFVTENSSVEDGQYVSVEIKLSNDTAEHSVCQTFRIDTYGVSGYDAAGMGIFPGSAWDKSDPLKPRRLNLCFTEWDDDSGPLPLPNFAWDPDGSGGPIYGKREYLFVMLSD